MNAVEIAGFLNETLEIHRITDESLNGLQVENTGPVDKVALAVDASYEAFRAAREKKAQMLIVHHGLFWDKPNRLTDVMYRRCRFLIENNIALYAAHLPLDVHPELGHAALVMKRMGWTNTMDFGLVHDFPAGKEIILDAPVPLEEIIEKMQAVLECRILAWKFGAPNTLHLGYVSGGGIGLLPEAITQRMDTFITGEPKHSFYWIAKEAGINVLFAGHYAMEKAGLSALASLLEEKYHVKTEMIYLPTGL